MWHYYPDFSSSLVSCLYHMGNESPISLALWWYSSPKSVVGITGSVICSPFIEREGWICDDRIKLHKSVSFFQFWIIQGISPTNSGVIESVEEHIHDSKCPSISVCLLPEECKIIRFDFFSSFDEERS